MSDDWYRRHLAESQAAAHDAYDQALLKLSGGALGLSLALVRGFAADDMRYLIAIQSAWVFWVLSLICVVASFYFGARSAATQARQYDAATVPAQVIIPNSPAESASLSTDEVDGGVDARRASWCNKGSGCCFAFGVLLAGFFMISNLDGGSMPRDTDRNQQCPAPTETQTREEYPGHVEHRARDPHPAPPRPHTSGSQPAPATPSQGSPPKKSN